jgi:hypothetical protein
MEQLIIANAKHLRRPTAFGIKKVLRNILALQQVVKTLTDDVQESDFDHAKEYYSLFFLTPQVRNNLYLGLRLTKLRRKCLTEYVKNKLSRLKTTRTCLIYSAALTKGKLLIAIIARIY